MIPIRDENPTRRVPVVNYLFIAINVGIWLLQVWAENNGITYLTAAYGLVPRRFLLDPLGEAFTLFTSMFMHGGWAHVGGNMLFLYVFGDNIEDALGRTRYILFYILGGLAAAGAQIAMSPTSTLPMVGASGAIAAVLGGYLVLHPRAPITVVNPIFFLWFLLGPLLIFPAWLVVGEWFLWNLFGVASVDHAEGGGVAFFAHIGGFILGLLAVRPLAFGRAQQVTRTWEGWRAPPRSYRHNYDSEGNSGWSRPRSSYSRPTRRWY